MDLDVVERCMKHSCEDLLRSVRYSLILIKMAHYKFEILGS